MIYNMTKITKIERTKQKERVFDIEVDHYSHAFIAQSANGAKGISHNSATISLSNLSDDRMRNAKTGQWWVQNPQRSLANNSVAYTEKPDIEIFMREWLSLIESKSGERGIFNRVGAQKKAAQNEKRKSELVALTNPCLVGETLVSVADGRGCVPFKQLAEEGLDVPVYCLNNEDEIVIRMLCNPRVTGVDVPIYEMKIENGHTIRCTGNHKFLLNGRGYVEVNQIKPGDSLSLMTQYSSKNGNNEYWQLQRKGKEYPEHQLIATFNHGYNKGHVHHIDGNSLNNSPNNLKFVSIEEHNELHNKSFSQQDFNGEKNPNANLVSNEEIREHACYLVKQLNRPFSTSEWGIYAKENNLPQFFSDWRKPHLGSVSILSRWASLESGIICDEYRNLDLKTIKKIIELTKQGYDVRYEDDYIFRKTCSCGNTFETKNRENMYCSNICRPDEWKDMNSQRIKEGQKTYFDAKKEITREQQSHVFIDVSQFLEREPKKSEWVEECKKRGISCEISRNSSPFRNFEDLKTYSHNYNHKVISVEFVGYDTVYNGTVEEFHNFFVGGWEEPKRKGQGNKLIFLNNRQCGEILLRNSRPL